MATITSDSRFDMTRLFVGYELSSDSVERSGTTEVSWRLFAPGGFFPPMEVTLTGTGLTYGADGAPTGGTINSLLVVLDRLHPDAPSLRIDDVSLPFTALLPDGFAVGLDSVVLFDLALGAADDMSVGSGAVAYGDLNVVSTALGAMGGDDMTLTGTDGILWGDAQVIQPGAEATGGDDFLRATGLSDFGLRMIGDAQGMTGGTFTGGDDTLRNTASGTDFARDLLTGDVQELSGVAHLTGGDDRLTGAAALGDVMFGDVQGVFSAEATLVAGDDTLYGRGGDDLLYGDTDQIQAGDVTPGNDRLFGGAGNDILYGDYARNISGVVHAGGHDLLAGGGGNDALLGQGGNDTLLGKAGSDTLVGDDGRDRLKGGAGSDLIHGGAGGDKLNGQGGADVFLFQSAEETGTGTQRDVIFGFGSGQDVLDLSAIAAGVAGGLSWVGEDYAKETNTIGYTDAGSRLRVLANLDEDSDAEVVFWVRGTDALTEADLIL